MHPSKCRTAKLYVFPLCPMLICCASYVCLFRQNAEGFATSIVHSNRQGALFCTLIAFSASQQSFPEVHSSLDARFSACITQETSWIHPLSTVLKMYAGCCSVTRVTGIRTDGRPYRSKPYSATRPTLCMTPPKP